MTQDERAGDRECRHQRDESEVDRDTNCASGKRKKQHDDHRGQDDSDVYEDPGKDAHVRNHERREVDRDRDRGRVHDDDRVQIELPSCGGDRDLEPRAESSERREHEVVAVAPEPRAVSILLESITCGLKEVQPPQPEDEDER